MPPTKSALLLLAALLIGSTSHAAITGFNLGEDYAQSLWPTGHRDQSNTDYVPVMMAQATRIGAHLLKGHPLLWPPASGPEGNLYVTSGKGEGYSNLHAFSQTGELLWKAPPQRNKDDVDALAIINAPVVDSQGTVFIGDSNQLWAFSADGETVWVADLEKHGAENGFITPILTGDNLVGGISSNGLVILFDRQTGELARPVLELPGDKGPPAQDSPPRNLWRDLLEPAVRPYLFNLMQGWEMEVANTPAVHPETGRIFITAQSSEPGKGVLYGIDVLAERIAIAFSTPTGQGSGTSPAVSHDGKRVYLVDENGKLLAVDSESGDIVWASEQKAGSSASPSVGPDETVYSPNKDYLLAFRPDGSLRFRHSYNDLCFREIPAPSGLWRLPLSEPVAFIDSIVTVDADNTGWINVVCGYHIKWLPSDSERTLTPVPVKSLLVAVDLTDGSPRNLPVVLPETSEGFITPVSNGNQFVTLSGALGSIFYHSLNPFLPASYEVPNEPAAGLLMLEPADRLALALQGIDWLRGRLQLARSQLADNTEQAIATLTSTTAQFYTTNATMREAGTDDSMLREATRATAQAIYLLNHALPAKADNTLTLALDHLSRQKDRLKKRREALRDETR